MVSVNLDAVFEFDTPARPVMSWCLCILELPQHLTSSNERNVFFLSYNSTKQTHNPTDNWSLGAPTTTLLQAKAANWKADRNQWDCEFAVLCVCVWCHIDFCRQFTFAVLSCGFLFFAQVRPFSPPKMTNASPPPTAPLARAESSSSLSSNASLSAGNTPTVGKILFWRTSFFIFLPHCTATRFSDLASHSSLLPSMTPLVTAAGHTVTPSLSSPEPELLTLSPFFLLSESAFPDFCFPPALPGMITSTVLRS